MTMTYDGRSRLTPTYEVGALPPEQFETEYCDNLMRVWLEHMPQVGPPEALDPPDAQLFHGTYLKYFSFFAWKFPSWLMAVASQCPYQDVRREIIRDCVDEEVGDPDADGQCHIDILYDEAEACGVSREGIYDASPTPAILAAIHAFENLSRTLGWLPGFSAVAALEIGQSEPAIRARERLTTPQQAAAYAEAFGGRAFHERLGLPEESLKFFAHHAYKDRFHGGGELRLLVKYANTSALQREALWAASASLQIMGLMTQEIVRLAHEAIGLEPDRTFMTQVPSVQASQIPPAPRT
ncbi:MAG: iron-containing redox enzyme family protein [Deltaproteobacteria bacterium]|nr:iron-containing redox enzyme family protein [Deltaproteobacteria bacterium]